MKTAEYMDQKIPKKRRDEISALRAERWELFAALHTRGDTEGVFVHRSPEAAKKMRNQDRRRWSRINEINCRLYVLTGNPIYDTHQ